MSDQNKNVPAVEARGLTVAYDQALALHDIDAQAHQGRITVICGANGSGKSTLLKTLAGLEAATSGEVRLSGQSLSELSRRDIARRVAVMSQSPEVPLGLTVEELVEQGRHPHRPWLGRLSLQDRDLIERAIRRVDLHPLRDRELSTLSGGERQRAWVAMALAQEPELLFLDEPTSFLDIRHQAELLTLLGQLNKEEGLTIVAVLHDLNQVMDIADDVLLMCKGKLLATGSTGQVLQADLLEQAFGCKVDIVPHPRNQKRGYCLIDWVSDTGGPSTLRLAE